jgi:hypothetical protein
MSNLPDAPWIRDAERDGYTVGDDWSDDAERRFDDAKEYLLGADSNGDKLLEMIAAAEETLDTEETQTYAESLEDIYTKLDELMCDLRNIMHNLGK